jgi:hypothetical protein
MLGVSARPSRADRGQREAQPSGAFLQVGHQPSPDTPTTRRRVDTEPQHLRLTPAIGSDPAHRHQVPDTVTAAEEFDEGELATVRRFLRMVQSVLATWREQA